MFLIAMSGLLVFSVVTSAFASTAYFDYMVGGNANENPGNVDLNQYQVGVEVPLDQFKVGLEYESNTLKVSSGDQNVTGIKLKGGYNLLKTDVFNLNGDLSYLSLSGDSSTSNLKYSPILIGVDASYAISEKSFFTGNLDYAVSGQVSSDVLSNTDSTYTAAKVKYVYHFNEQLGVNVGYEWSDWNIKGNVDMTRTGYTLGLAYNF
jgi:hypothetical protein